MQITLQYFEGCPNWKVTQAHIEELQGEGVDLDVVHQLIDTPEAAEAAGFRGSPSVIVEGVDPFADPDAPVGLACRVYRTETGFAGSPTLEQLRAAIVTSDT